MTLHIFPFFVNSNCSLYWLPKSTDCDQWHRQMVLLIEYKWSVQPFRSSYDSTRLHQFHVAQSLVFLKCSVDWSFSFVSCCWSFSQSSNLNIFDMCYCNRPIVYLCIKTYASHGWRSASGVHSSSIQFTTVNE